MPAVATPPYSACTSVQELRSNGPVLVCFTSQCISQDLVSGACHPQTGHLCLA